jgi:hypothetical protein
MKHVIALILVFVVGGFLLYEGFKWVLGKIAVQNKITAASANPLVNTVTVNPDGTLNVTIGNPDSKTGFSESCSGAICADL